MGTRGTTLPFDLLRLARPKQWAKNVFVLVGAVYGQALSNPDAVQSVLAAFVAFCLAGSGCYVFNDLRDRDADRNHPRKKLRPLASGRIAPGLGAAFGILLLALSAGCLLLVPSGGSGPLAHSRLWLGVCLGLYVLNVSLYTLFFKHIVVLDVIALSVGFVLRVLGGCAAAGVEPSSWLLNVTFFVSMFLAVGKRLGERQALGEEAGAARGVHRVYTLELLRMVVVVTGVATLLSYSEYVQSQSARYTLGFNLLWLTLLPATYALLRALVLLERGAYDDPTELATRDRPFQASVTLFGVLTICLMVLSRQGTIGLRSTTSVPPPLGPTTPR